MFGPMLCALADLVVHAAGLTLRRIGFPQVRSARIPMATPNNSEGSARFTDRMFVRYPPSLPAGIDKAAAQQLMSASEYIRRSVIDRLGADDVNPSPIEQKD
jgi:hypothetical protein